MTQAMRSYIGTLNLISTVNQAKLDTFFSKADSDKDGMINKEEMINYVSANNISYPKNDMN